MEILLFYNIRDMVTLEKLMVMAFNKKIEPYARLHIDAIPDPDQPERPFPFSPDMATIDHIRYFGTAPGFYSQSNHEYKTRLMIAIRRFLCVIIILAVPATASAGSGTWRYALGYCFLNNVNELKHSYKNLSKEASDGDDIYNTSINLSFQPYYQFQSGFRAGAGAGPLIIFLGDAHHVQIPVNVTFGYSFFPDSTFCPYFRAGISYHMASGDFYSDSSPGLYGGIGVEIFNTKPVHLGFECVYDAAKVTLDRSLKQHHGKIKAGEMTFFLYADFQ